MSKTQDKESKQNLTVQESVRRMQQDYASKGMIKTEDLIKVLGDPSKGVSATLPVSYSDSLVKWG